MDMASHMTSHVWSALVAVTLEVSSCPAVERCNEACFEGLKYTVFYSSKYTLIFSSKLIVVCNIKSIVFYSSKYLVL